MFQFFHFSSMKLSNVMNNCESQKLSFQVSESTLRCKNQRMSKSTLSFPINDAIGQFQSRSPSIFRMVSLFWTHSPISLCNVFISVSMLTTNLAIYHLNIGVQLGRVTTRPQIPIYRLHILDLFHFVPLVLKPNCREEIEFQATCLEWTVIWALPDCKLVTAHLSHSIDTRSNWYPLLFCVQKKKVTMNSSTFNMAFTLCGWIDSKAWVTTPGFIYISWCIRITLVTIDTLPAGKAIFTMALKSHE